MAKIFKTAHSGQQMICPSPYTKLAAAICGILLPFSSMGNPHGGTVVSGTATISGAGHVMTITNSPGAIINWDSFSINKGELTQFIQQSAASQVLNRVTGQDPTQILGSLQSNGQVFIINPNGVSFGNHAQVDVAGLVVSSLNLSNGNFQAANLVFDANPGAGMVQNAGAINASSGDIILIAPLVQNSGLMTAANGDILLLAGAKVSLLSLDHPAVSVELSAAGNQAVNLGQLIAKNISIFGSIVENNGQISADRAVLGENGKIILDASQQLTTGTDSQITANGSSPGTVILASGNTAEISGSVQAVNQTDSATQATAGVVAILGQQVQVKDNAQLDVSGEKGGGSLLIGGDEHGQLTHQLQTLISALPTMSNEGGTGHTAVNNRPPTAATNVSVSASADLRANALSQGNGGKIIVFADDTADIFGNISATGGVLSGNGGFLETSGKMNLAINTVPELTAAHGHGGTWLLDPANITINATGNDQDNSNQNTFPSNPGDNLISNNTINTLLNAGVNVSISTNGAVLANDPPGNININAEIDKAAGSAATLTLMAANNIDINANIIATSGNLNLNLNANQGNTGGSSYLAGGVVLNTNNGEVAFSNGFNVSGTISNSSLVSLDGSVLTGNNATLNQVTLGDATHLHMQTLGSFLVENNLNLFNALSLDIQNSQFAFIGNGLTGSRQQMITAVGAANPAAILQMENGFIGTNNPGNTEVLAIANGVTVQGYGQIGDAQADNIIINNGNIINNSSQLLSINPGFFLNHGTMSVQSGEILVNPSKAVTSWINSGSIQIAGNAEFALQGQDLINNGTINGIGSIDLGSRDSGTGLIAGTLVNNGYLAPQTVAGDVGTLTVIGNLVNNGTLAIALAGIGSTDYGRVVMTENAAFPPGQLANASLGGTLKISETGGFFADLGNHFSNIISADGTVNGAFNQYSVPVDVNFVYSNAGNFSITDTTASVTRWIAADGDWSNANNWSRGIPDALKDAVLTGLAATTPTVTIDNGNQAAHALIMADNLILSGGSLTLANGNNLISGMLTQNGGNLINDSSLTLGGQGNFNGGVLNNNGTLLVTGTINLQGITYIGGGNVNNQGVINDSDTANISTNTGIISNTGTLNFVGVDIGNAIVNQGTLNSQQSIYFASVENNGTLNLAGGNSFNNGLQLDAGSFTTGTANATANINNTPLAVSGLGTVTVNGVAFDNVAATSLGSGQTLVLGNSVLAGAGGLTILGAVDLQNSSLIMPVTVGDTGVLTVQSTMPISDLTLNNNGTVVVDAGKLNVTAGSQSGSFVVNNAGQLDFSGQQSFNNRVQLSGSGQVVFNGGDYSGTGVLTNNTTVTLNGDNAFSATVVNNGAWQLNAGVDQFQVGLTQNSGHTNFNGAVFEGNLNLNGGTLTGTGDVTGNLNVAGGTIYNNSTIGQLTINGNLTLDANSTLNISVLGAGQSGYDYLNVQGAATLAGEINVNLASGYMPVANSQLNVLNYASSSGNFNIINLPAGDVNYQFTAHGLVLLIDQAPTASGDTSNIAANPFDTTTTATYSQTVLQAGIQNPLVVSSAINLLMPMETSHAIFFTQDHQVDISNQSCQ